MLFVNIGLARRLEMVEVAVASERAEASKAQFPGDEIATLPIAGGLAVYTGATSPLTQAVWLGMHGPIMESEIGRMEAFYDERGVETRVTVCPFVDPSLIQTLERRGFRIKGFLNVLVRPIRGEDSTLSSDGTEVRRTEANETHAWAETIAQGFSEQPAAGQRMATAVAHQRSSTEFLARVEGEIAGAASVAIHDGVAALSTATTFTEFRGRGIHSSLIQARLAHAASQECDLAVAEMRPGSSPQRNVERAGFRVIYTKVQLMRPVADTK